MKISRDFVTSGSASFHELERKRKEERKKEGKRKKKEEKKYERKKERIISGG